MGNAVSAHAKGTVHGVPSVMLESEQLQLSILPEVGGKIYDLIWKPEEWNVLWHNPRVLPQPYPAEAALGDLWCGGWDDIFPTCEACEFGGLRYPGLGELHLVRWSVDDVRTKGDEATAHLSAFTPISPVKAEKMVMVSGADVRVRHAITNLAMVPANFIWGTHPAFRPTTGMILRMPATTGIVAQSSGPQFGEPGQRYPWPTLSTPRGNVTDMSRIYGMDAKGSCGHYAIGLQEGWYALEDTASGIGVVVTFPVTVCPFIWMWLAYGGWRGHWVVIIEPYTSYPVTLSEAYRQNTHRQIEPDETFSVDITMSVYRKPETHVDVLRRVR